jgi:hypothetical protein
LKIKEKILDLLEKKIFCCIIRIQNLWILEISNSPVSHFVKAEPLDKNFFFSKKVSAYNSQFLSNIT